MPAPKKQPAQQPLAPPPGGGTGGEDQAQQPDLMYTPEQFKSVQETFRNFSPAGIVMACRDADPGPEPVDGRPNWPHKERTQEWSEWNDRYQRSTHAMPFIPFEMEFKDNGEGFSDKFSERYSVYVKGVVMNNHYGRKNFIHEGRYVLADGPGYSQCWVVKTPPVIPPIPPATPPPPPPPDPADDPNNLIGQPRGG